MDKLINMNSFPHLSGKLTENQFKNLRILCVFGKRSTIYVTAEDEVYGFGHNQYGCLGLGVYELFIPTAKLNRTLSHRNLQNIYFGYNHCIGLTRSGHCYAWGHNEVGQLGDGSTKTGHTPTLIEELRHKKVVQICCGNSHNIALTDMGRVYTWGRNHTGQLGDHTFNDSYWPIHIPFEEKVKSVSCGKTHSLALTESGEVYLWGSNKFGQLGRKPVNNRFNGKICPSNRPLRLHSMASYLFTKAICGPNHSLLLTSSGQLFGFGLNDFGQVGDGSDENKFFPIKVGEEIKFKDIATSYMCHISVGLSVDNKYYIWGLCSDSAQDKCVLKPEQVVSNPSDPTLIAKSLFDIYANYAIFKITYKSIVVTDEDIESIELIQNHMTEELDIYLSDNSSIASNRTSIISDILKKSTNSTSKQSTSAKPNALLNSLLKSFNNPLKSDITFRFDEQVIYGHKTILCIRNQKFWQKCEQLLDKENAIRFKTYSYKSFYVFIQYLYTNSVDIEAESAAHLLCLANTYDEKELKDSCNQYFANNIDVTNVCQFYTNSIEQGLHDLQKICIDFVAKYYRQICLTLEFEEMNDSLAKKMIISAMRVIQESISKFNSKRSFSQTSSERTLSTKRFKPELNV